jgi:pimeloyl-ACP methyl ester carboxylesterase
MTTGYGSDVGAATLMRGFRPHVAEIRGLRTEYWLGGEGPPLLLIHGLGGAAVNFTELAPLLARRHRVLVPDLPGHGGSEALRSVENLSDLAEHVLAVAEHESLVPTAVLGYSLGGVVAMRLAVDRPDMVSALALVAPAGIVSTSKRARIWVALVGVVRPARIASRLRGLVARRANLRRLVFGYWGAERPADLSPEAVLGFLEAPPRHTDVESAGWALLQDDPRQDLARIRCPALLVWGARDRLVPLDDGFEYARRLRCGVRAVPAAGHLLVGEYPELCADLLESVLSDGVREVDELPRDAELLAELRREGANT